MSIQTIQTEHHSGLQDQVESGSMNVPAIQPSTFDRGHLQTLEYSPPSTIDLYSFSRDEVIRELGEIRDEVSETCEVADNVKAVPESAYDETRSLLERMQRNIPMPDMMWLEDGGIGLEWRPGDGIVTMSLYGDNHVTFIAILGDQREIAGMCSLSDPIILPSFLETLPRLFRQRA